MNKAPKISSVDQMKRNGRALIVSLVEDMEVHARAKYGLTDDWRVKIRFSIACGRKNSWGGVRFFKPFISISVGKIIFDNPVNFQFVEYPHIADDPQIGTDGYNDWAEYIIMITTHEVAHAIQHTLTRSSMLQKDPSNHEFAHEDLMEAHGSAWQAIYRDLRVKYLTAYREGNGIRPGPTKEPKRLQQEKQSIGMVRIAFGHYRNNPVYGDFEMFREWQPSVSKMFGPSRILGTIGIIAPQSRKRIRVTVTKNKFELI